MIKNGADDREDKEFMGQELEDREVQEKKGTLGWEDVVREVALEEASSRVELL